METKEVKEVVKAEKDTVSKEMYEELYTKAVELDTRYKRLFAAYNQLLDLYLSAK